MRYERKKIPAQVKESFKVQGRIVDVLDKNDNVLDCLIEVDGDSDETPFITNSLSNEE